MKKTGVLISTLSLWWLLTGFYLVEPKIIGGVDEIDPPPYMVHMIVVVQESSGTSEYLCGASYIGQKKVLTAAHCLFGDDNRKAREVRMAFNVPDGERSKLEASDYVVSSRFRIFPGYDNSNFGFDPSRDAALIILDEKPAGVQPILMASGSLTRELIADSAEVTAYGWGQTEDGTTSDVLQKVNLNMDRAEDYFTASHYPSDFFDFVLAAGATNTDKDACFGDSGGPLVYEAAGGAPVLVGLTSFGRLGCAAPGEPGGYTKVSRIRDWAEDEALYAVTSTVVPRRVNETTGAFSPLFLLMLVLFLLVAGRRRFARP